MNMMNSNEKILEIRAIISQKEGMYEICAKDLALKSEAPSLDEAQEMFIEVFRDWAYQFQEGGALEEALEDAGYKDVDEDTVIHLLMVEQGA